MLEEHKAILRKHHTFLIENVHIGELLEHLVSSGVVEHRDVARFTEGNIREDAVKAFLEFLPTCDDELEPFEHLCESLKRIKQGGIAKKLEAAAGGADAVDAGAVGGASARQDHYLCHPLADTGDTAREYNEIKDKFMKYIVPQHNWTPQITRIDTVVNSKLRKNWDTAKNNMWDPEQKSELKFHGTDKAAVKSILKDGFKLLGTGGWYGKGVYFASDSSKAGQERYTKGSYSLLVCNVLLGKSMTVDCRQPDMTHEKLRAEGYDSLYARRDTQGIGGVCNDEFVVYKPEQALPKYVVYYTL